MLKTIKVYGALAKFLGQRKFKADVASPAEAMRFLVCNFPQLRGYMADRHYKVLLGSEELAIKDDPEQLHAPAGHNEICIVPVVSGAGGTVGQILAGVALIALSFVSFGGVAFAGAAGAAGIFGGTGAAWGSTLLFGIGASLVLGGVASLLTPVPQMQQKDEKDPRKSYSFSGIQNTSRQGIPVPVIYGETIVGSITISAGIDIVQVTA